MNTADVITAFLSNEMSPEQEREFLLSVAASDSMRLGLKSHVMLDRLLSHQVQSASVPESVRSTIFAAMSASMAEPIPASTPGDGSEAFASQPRFGTALRSLASKIARPALITMLTLAGFTAGYYTASETRAPGMSERTVVSVPTTPRDIRPSAPAVSIESPAASAVRAMPQEVAVAELPRYVGKSSVQPAASAPADRRHVQKTPVSPSVQHLSPVTVPAFNIPTPAQDLPPFESGNVARPSSVDTEQAKPTATKPTVVPEGMIEVQLDVKDPSDTNTPKPRE